MGRARKSTAELKLENTYRADRHAKNSDTLLPLLIDMPTEDKIAVPAEIKDKYVQRCFTQHIQMLEQLHLLATVDLPEIENLYITLQSLRQVSRQLKKTSIISNFDMYERLQKLFIRLSNHFSLIASRYYINPTARMRIQLDALNVQKAKNESMSITEKLIAAKRA
jgi:hypothetical protein